MISELHLRSWLRIPEVEIVAVGNRTIARAEQRRAQFVPAARVYSDLATMLDRERPDFVDILTAPAQHLEHCRVARERDLHIICQKPLADTLENARAIAALMAGCNRIFVVHENHRYRPWFRGIAEQVRAGEYGQIAFAQFQHLNPAEPPPGFKTESGAGVLLEYGSHLVDMMRAVLGEPRRVQARLHRVNSDIRGESLAHAVYEYENATANVSVAWKGAGVTQGSVVICGERREAYYEGTLTRGEAASRLRVCQGREIVVDQSRSPVQDYEDSFYLLQREAVDAMMGRGTIVQTAEEHMRTLACTFAAYESARRAAPVDIAEFRARSGFAAG